MEIFDFNSLLHLAGLQKEAIPDEGEHPTHTWADGHQYKREKAGVWRRVHDGNIDHQHHSGLEEHYQQKIKNGRREEDVAPSRKIDISHIPEHVKTVANAVKSAGGRALLVGGSVRDSVLGKQAKDFDIECYGLHPDKVEQALKQLGKVDAVGKSFGVLKLKIGDVDMDVSVPRRESKSGTGHKGFIPVPDHKMTISEAGKRRDFTINSLSLDPHTGHVYDPHGGLRDMQDGVIRATDDKAFSEDPLRVLRGAQFAARMNMKIHPDTMELMRNIKGELKTLPRERVGEEWHKLLMKSDKPSIGIQAMLESGALKELHPELHKLHETPQDKEWHPEGNVGVHTGMVVDRAVALTKDSPDDVKEVVRYAALLHDIAKPQTTETTSEGRITSHGHEAQGEALSEKVLKEQFNLSDDKIQRIKKIVGEHLSPTMLHEQRDKLSDSAIRRLALRLKPATIEELVLTAQADHEGRDHPNKDKFPQGQWLLDRAKALDVASDVPKPILGGKHLLDEKLMEPGPEMGKLLGQVFQMQLDGKVKTLEEAKAAAKELLKKSFDGVFMPKRWKFISANGSWHTV
jgi:tRNA nucleotidyltransferase (CCA-adding enzyme)